MKDKKIRKIPEHESGVRRIMSEMQGIDYHPLKSFEEAKQYDDAYVIMEGDWGGQIYLSIPAKQIMCSYETLKSLLSEIDKHEWKHNDGEGIGIYFERKKAGEGISGGMGGGLALEGLWVHDDIKGIEKKILDVLNGNKKSINE